MKQLEISITLEETSILLVYNVINIPIKMLISQ